MSSVIVKENETLDSALRRFKRNCAKAGIQQEIRNAISSLSADIRFMVLPVSVCFTARKNGSTSCLLIREVAK